MQEQKGKSVVSVEETLLHQLRHGGIDKDRLKELVGAVAGLQKRGVTRMKAFPIGIPPVVDGIRVTAVLEITDAIRLTGEILTSDLLSKIVFHPIGVPVIEQVVANLDFGSPIQTAQ